MFDCLIDHLLVCIQDLVFVYIAYLSTCLCKFNFLQLLLQPCTQLIVLLDVFLRNAGVFNCMDILRVRIRSIISTRFDVSWFVESAFKSERKLCAATRQFALNVNKFLVLSRQRYDIVLFILDLRGSSGDTV